MGTQTVLLYMQAYTSVIIFQSNPRWVWVERLGSPKLHASRGEMDPETRCSFLSSIRPAPRDGMAPSLLSHQGNHRDLSANVCTHGARLGPRQKKFHSQVKGGFGTYILWSCFRNDSFSKYLKLTELIDSNLFLLSLLSALLCSLYVFSLFILTNSS